VGEKHCVGVFRWAIRWMAQLLALMSMFALGRSLYVFVLFWAIALLRDTSLYWFHFKLWKRVRQADIQMVSLGLFHTHSMLCFSLSLSVCVCVCVFAVCMWLHDLACVVTDTVQGDWLSMIERFRRNHRERERKREDLK